jgi:hypothetical protein
MQFLPEELTLCVICGTMKHCTAGVCGRCSKKDKHDPAIQTYLREMIDGAVREERDRITKEVKELIEKYEPAYEQEDKACIAGMAMTLAIINTPNEL